MPYIIPEQREEVDALIEELAKRIRLSGYWTGDMWWKSGIGVLNYCITKLLLQTIPERRYWAIALWCGMVHNVADEFYRRYATPYETEQRIKHGDVYQPEPKGEEHGM